MTTKTTRLSQTAENAIAENVDLNDIFPDADGFGLNASIAKSSFPRKPKKRNRTALVIALLRRPEGATVAQVIEATGWQAHTVRAFISTAKKKLGVEITTTREKMDKESFGMRSMTTYFAASPDIDTSPSVNGPGESFESCAGCNDETQTDLRLTGWTQTKIF